jgi:hypothetical protein
MSKNLDSPSGFPFPGSWLHRSQKTIWTTARREILDILPHKAHDKRQKGMGEKPKAVHAIVFLKGIYRQ